MNIAIFIAGCLCLLTVAVHELMGTKEIALPIMATNLTLEIKAIWRIVWHSITFSFLFNGVALIILGLGERNIIAALLIAAYNLSFAALFCFFSYKLLSNPFVFPHPWLFSIIAILILFGTFARRAINVH